MRRRTRTARAPSGTGSSFLAAITEMIHTASLVHDDVLDAADTRRGAEAVHKLYSNKAAVLSGDYLLARVDRARAPRARRGDASRWRRSLESLVQGEIMQLRSTAEERLSLEYYPHQIVLQDGVADGAVQVGRALAEHPATPTRRRRREVRLPLRRARARERFAPTPPHLRPEPSRLTPRVSPRVRPSVPGDRRPARLHSGRRRARQARPPGPRARPASTARCSTRRRSSRSSPR